MIWKTKNKNQFLINTYKKKLKKLKTGSLFLPSYVANLTFFRRAYDVFKRVSRGAKVLNKKSS